MSVDFYPLRVLLTTLAGWMNRQQQDVIAYLVEENRVLKEQLKGKRLQLGNERITDRAPSVSGPIRCRGRLGGILKHYKRAA